jgi:hypothetical protein
VGATLAGKLVGRRLCPFGERLLDARAAVEGEP